MLVLLHLFVLCVLVVLGFYVFVVNPRSRAHQTFAAFIAFLGVWNVKDLVFWNFYDARLGTGWWLAASFICALFMQYALVVFAWVFPENSRTPRRLAAILFSPGIFLTVAALAGLLWQNAEFADGRLAVEFSPAAYFFVVYVYFLFFYGGYVLFRKYERYRSTEQGQQLASILWGLTITGVLMTAANIVLPMLGDLRLLRFNALFILPGVFIYAYAVSNFKLFSLQSALDQLRLFPLTYKIALTVAAVAVVSFILFQIPIVWWSFENGMSYEAWRRYLVFSVISAMVPNLLLVLLVVRTIARPLQRIAVAAVKVTDGNYGTEVELRRSNDEIGIVADSFNNMSRKLASDIEQMKRLNEHLLRTDRLAAMGTLAAGVAHEVNNPLASISSLVQMLRKNADGDRESAEMLTLVSEQIERIARVTKDLTEFARVRPAARTNVSINALIESSLRLASFDARFQKLSVVAEFDETLPRIEVDADQIQQVFLNLFFNARDAMPDGGELTVRTARTDNAINITIKDTGTGISDAAVKQIFDPFFTTKPTGEGTGLGLSVCYGIVTAHDGTVELTRTGPEGSEFTVKLPAAMP